MHIAGDAGAFLLQLSLTFELVELPPQPAE